MATATLTNTLTPLSAADINTGWTGTTVADTEFKKQGTGSLSGTLRTVGTNLGYYTVASTDIQNTHIRIWVSYAAPGFIADKSAGGIRIYVYSGTTAGYWYVSGGDMYDGGWALFTVDTARALDSGAPNLAAVTRIGFALQLTGAPRNATNTWADYLAHGNQGYTISGGTSGDMVTMENIYLADVALGLGVTRKVNGVYYLNSAIVLGLTSGTTNGYFNFDGQIIVFEDQLVNADLYKITCVGATTNTTSVAIANSVIKSANTSTRYDLIASDANLDSLSITGSSLVNADTITFKAGQSATNNVFQNCNTINVSTATFTGNTVSGSTTSTGTLVLPTSGLAVSNCNFLNNAAAVKITAAGDYIFNNMTFSGNTKDVYVTATSGIVNISLQGTSNCSTYTSLGATVNFIVDQKTFTLTGIVAGSEVGIYKTSDMTELYHTESSTGTDSYSYTYTSDIPIYIMIVNNSYEHLKISTTLTSSSTSIPVQQRLDRWYTP